MSILLVRLRLIGDVVFTTPAIAALRRRYPAARLVYLVEAHAAPVVLDNPHLNDVVVIAHSRGWRRLGDDLRLARRLRAARFDVVIDFHGGPRSAWLTWATNAPVRVGYDVPGRHWMYTAVVHRPRSLRPRHSVLNQWDLLGAVDPALSAPPDPDTDRVEMPVTDAARHAIDRRWAQWDIPAGARVVVLHVSAGNPFRKWPEASFVELTASLADSSAPTWVIVTAGPSDRTAVARVIASARLRAPGGAARIVDGADVSLAELRALVDRAALFIGGDSGPLHVASASDTPIVGLYGPTLPERSRPWRPARIQTAAVDVGALPCRPCDQRHCAPGDFRCLTQLPVATVRQAAQRILESAS